MFVHRTFKCSRLKRYFRRIYNEECQKIEFPNRFNVFDIEMIGLSLHRQLFKFDPHPLNKEKMEKSFKELITNDLLKDQKTFTSNVNFPLPKLLGNTLEEHFMILGYEFCLPYLRLAYKLIESSPKFIPKEFFYHLGWTKYYEDGTHEFVNYPDSDVLVLDVECSVYNKNVPVMATAVSDKHWYSWVSKYILYERKYELCDGLPCELNYDDLIPLGPRDERPSLIIGHNVAFDRSYIKEEYLPTPNFTYFLDTMSLHIMIRGYAEAQRSIIRDKDLTDKSDPIDDEGEDSSEWVDEGSFNSLEALARFYLGIKLDKSPLSTLLESDFYDIYKEFDILMTYCAKDVITTLDVFKEIWKQYHDVAPHPVTLSGMLIMSKCYLPITQRWDDYINAADNVFNNYQREMESLLTKICQNHLSEGLTGMAYQHDPWLKQLDWTIIEVDSDDYIKRYLQLSHKEKKLYIRNRKKADRILKEALKVKDPDILYQLTHDMDWFPDLPPFSEVFSEFQTSSFGYPIWFGDLIDHIFFDDNIGPKPCALNLSHRLVPILIKLSWNGFPLKYDEALQWGYLLPKDLLVNNKINVHGKMVSEGNKVEKYNVSYKDNPNPSPENTIIMRGKIWDDKSEYDDLITQDYLYQRFYGIYSSSEYISESDPRARSFYKKFPFSQDVTVYEDVEPEFMFVPIPHPEGKNKLCGNPMGNEYAQYFHTGTLVPMCGPDSMRFIQLHLSMSFWKNNRDRIMEQTLVYFKKHQIPKEISKSKTRVGALIPRVIPAGAVTRRAIERTWLTAINPEIDSIGSELKSCIEAPEGFCFVGADVDSEEIWIASLIADAAILGTPGCTPFSFMTIQGTKSQGSDLHSITAKAIGIDRDNAKILNYGRLYGAGVEFAKGMIKQHQPDLTDNEAFLKAIYLYNFTKGIKCIELSPEGEKLLNKLSDDKTLYSIEEFTKLMRKYKISPKSYNIYGTEYWQGGTESEIFNVLEAFVRHPLPTTPALGVSVPHSLTQDVVGEEFLTSRMNWVVQSSAVDFLHIFLTCSFWIFSLLKIPARLCICIHDEIRFMVPTDKKYEAAFSLHVSNLFTRSAFSQRLGVYDLPSTCAFFSNVDIDKILRKEPTHRCQTPSNPSGTPQVISGFECESLNIRQTLEKVEFDIFTKDKLKDILDSKIFD